MTDEKKTKKELIAELLALRKKYSDLEASFLRKQNYGDIDGTETLLVVDDNQDARTFIVGMLERCGYHLHEAGSFEDAVKRIEAGDDPVHLVLCDVVMPGMSGPEIVDRLLVKQPDLKVVFMSGYADDAIVSDEVFDVLNSHYSFVKKPFTLKEVGQAVRQELDKP